MELRRQPSAPHLWPSSLAYIVLLLSFPAISSKSDNITDRLGLLSFKSLLSNPSQALPSWNEGSLDACGWQGVTCHIHRGQPRVTALDLDSMNLAGPISSSIANLTFLRRLDLSDNRLYGSIPEELGHLRRLRYLNLSFNSLEEVIPPTLSLCSRLQVISLRDNKLRGAIPSNLSHCPDLQIISLQNNFLTGEIPRSLGTLQNLTLLLLSSNLLEANDASGWGFLDAMGNQSNLQLLELDDNQLAGTIPASIGKLRGLSILFLNKNEISGVIPPPLQNLSSLVDLDLSHNNLTGGIPPFLGNLTSLTSLFLSHNSLGGGIPPSLGNLFALEQLVLSSNGLVGEMPSPLWNFSSLRDLEVHSNVLTGSLPHNIGDTLPNLRNFLMYENELQGPIPMSLSNASGLQWIELYSNRFSGTIPNTLGTLPSLTKVILAKNQLEAEEPSDWAFLTALTNCTNLLALQLDFNMLGGALPGSIANLSTKLEMLTMGENQILGHIPPEIENLVGLNIIDFGNNLLEGHIPATIGRLQNLRVLYINENKHLSGEIPSTIGNLTHLVQLYLDFNNLTGSIPPSLGNCKQLQLLNLRFNKLTGSIPKEVLKISSLTIYLVLSNNKLVGSLPSDVGSLINLEILDVSENKLSGEIPSSLGDCSHIEDLYLQGNLFSGIIPTTLSELRGLQELDLSRNNLSGPIPEFLERLNLSYLNLSFNNFQGEVPKDGVFGNASAISILGNNKLCGGNPILNLPPCATHVHGKKHKSRRLIVIVSVVGTILCLIILFSFLVACYLIKSRKELPRRTSMKDKHIKVSYAELLKATDGFSSANLIGVGSFGSVYKGIMDYDEHKVVAVKVLNLQQRGASRSFIAECDALRAVRHRNLVKILTSCSSLDYQGNDFKALVFEFMTCGNLDNWLHPEANEQVNSRKLSLFQRLNIAIDVASALDYLHSQAPLPIIHCDVKPSNVLLDDDMVAHVGDFGLARFLSTDISNSPQISSSSLILRGSIGYVAPEYGVTNKVSIQGDAYSFGIILLEMFTGRRPTDETFTEGLNLHRYVARAFPELLMDIVDPNLVLQDEREESRDFERERGRDHTQNIEEVRGGEKEVRVGEKECIASIFRIGLLCSKDSPTERMEMRDVIKELHAIKGAFSRD